MAFKFTVDYANLRAIIDTDSLEPVSVFQNLKTVVTFTDLNGIVQYVNLSAVGVLLDAYSKDLFFLVGTPNAEAFSFSDTIAITSFAKALGDTATLEEQAALAFTLATQTESVSVSESFSRVVSFVRSFSDSISLVDTASNDDPLTTDCSTGITHTATLSDASSFSFAFGTQTDSVATSDSLISVFAKALSETPSVSDALAYSFSTSTSDSATMSESITVLYISGANSVLNTSALNTFELNS